MTSLNLYRSILQGFFCSYIVVDYKSTEKRGPVSDSNDLRVSQTLWITTIQSPVGLNRLFGQKIIVSRMKTVFSTRRSWKSSKKSSDPGRPFRGKFSKRVSLNPIYIQAYEDRIDLLRAVIVGAHGPPTTTASSSSTSPSLPTTRTTLQKSSTTPMACDWITTYMQAGMCAWA